MKLKMITAAVLSGALLAGGAAFAADADIIGGADAETAIVIEEKPDGATTCPEGGEAPTVIEGAAAQSADLIGGVLGDEKFLEEMKISSAVRYVPARLPKEKRALPVGQLQIKKNGTESAVYVMNCVISKKETKADIAPLFAAGSSSEKGLILLVANGVATQAEGMLNEKILAGIEALRKEWKEPIPYDIMRVELRDIEMLHEMEDRRAYTAGVRFFAYADGWVIPMYAKAYLYPDGKDYRVVGLLANDSERKEAREAGDLLIAKLAPKKK